MSSLKRPHRSHQSNDHAPPGPKRPRLPSLDRSVAVLRSRILPLPRAHVIRAMQNKQGSSQIAGVPATSKRSTECCLLDVEKVRAVVNSQEYSLV